MLCDLLQVLLAGLEGGRHGGVAPDEEKSPA